MGENAGFGEKAHTWLPSLVTLAREAGAAILHHYQDTQAATLDDKADGSPLTAADMAAHEVIVAGLQRISPDITIISEENKLNPPVTTGVPFWLVDPLDGTKEFINRNGEFTVNIALVQQGLPMLAVVYVPALGVAYVGQRGLGAWRIRGNGAPEPVTVSSSHDGVLRVVASRSHSDEKTLALLQRLPPNQMISAGSSLKFCMVAEGNADFYPRLGTTMEWDTAAAHCVLEAAGGRVVQCDGTPLRYNKKEWRNPHFFAVGVWLPVFDDLIATQQASQGSM